MDGLIEFETESILEKQSAEELLGHTRKKAVVFPNRLLLEVNTSWQSPGWVVIREDIGGGEVALGL